MYTIYVYLAKPYLPTFKKCILVAFSEHKSGCFAQETVCAMGTYIACFARYENHTK